MAAAPILSWEELGLIQGSGWLFQDLAIHIAPRDRLALIGRNGAGKSTLIRLLAGEAPPLAGIRREGKGLKIGYFAQHQLEQLRPDESPLWHMNHLDPRTRDQDFRNYLGGFNFHGEMATSPVGPFSGGEKSLPAIALRSGPGDRWTAERELLDSSGEDRHFVVEVESEGRERNQFMSACMRGDNACGLERR